MKKIVVCANIDEKSFKALERLKDHVDLSDASVNLLHYWSAESYPLEDNHVAAFYPNKEQAKEISEKMKEELQKQKERLKGLKPENFKVDVLTSNSPKRATVEYLKEAKADMVICLTPQKGKVEDFFHSSFTNYLASHAPCDLVMIRQK